MSQTQPAHDRSGADRVVRAMTDDGAFRIIALDMSSTVRELAAAQDTEGKEARQLSELLCAAVLLRETLAPDKRVQITLRFPDGSSSMAESRPDGACRGFVNAASPEAANAGGSTLFQVAYHRRDGSLHQSTTAAPAGAEVDVASALEHYLQTSEQVVATIGLASRGQDRSDLDACAYAVQLLPEASAESALPVTRKLEDTRPLQAFPAARSIIADIFEGLEHTELADTELSFRCTCSRDRVIGTLAGLQPADILELIAAGEDPEIRCDGCGAVYTVSLGELSGMLPSGGGDKGN